MTFKGDGYKADQQKAGESVATRITEESINIRLGIRAFKKANPKATGKDIKAYKQGAWAKLRELHG